MVGRRPSWVTTVLSVPHKFYGKSGQALVVVGAGAARPALVLVPHKFCAKPGQALVVVVVSTLSCPVLSCPDSNVEERKRLGLIYKSTTRTQRPPCAISQD